MAFLIKQLPKKEKLRLINLSKNKDIPENIWK